MVKDYGVQLPEYVTPTILECIKEMMAQDQIHPRHHLCDMTAEIAAGAPLKQALEEMIRRTGLNATSSIYQQIFPQRRY